MCNGIGEQTVIGFLRDRAARNGCDFRGPCGRDCIVRQFYHFQCGGWRGTIQSHEISELFDRRGGVFSPQRLMRGLEEDVKIQPGLIALELLKRARHDGAGKARFIPREGISFARERGSGGFSRWRRPDGLPSAPNHDHMCRYCYRNR